MNNKKRQAMAQQRRAMAEYEDYLESRKPPAKLVRIGELLRPHEHHKEDEFDDCISYTVLFDDNRTAHKVIRELESLGCSCHNESEEWEDYDGKDHMWSVSWTRKTIYG